MGSSAGPRVSTRRERISVGSYEPKRLHPALQPLEHASAEFVEDEFVRPPEPGPCGRENVKDNAAGEFKLVLPVQPMTPPC